MRAIILALGDLVALAGLRRGTPMRLYMDGRISTRCYVRLTRRASARAVRADLRNLAGAR